MHPRPSCLSSAFRALSSYQLRPNTQVIRIPTRTYAVLQPISADAEEAPKVPKRGRPRKKPLLEDSEPVLVESKPTLEDILQPQPVKKPRKAYTKKAATKTTSLLDDIKATGSLPPPPPKQIRPTKPKAIVVEDTLELPPIDKWRVAFPTVLINRLRISVRNPNTAALLADAFVPEGSKDKIIVEAFPGPGQLTRALMNLPKERISKIIVLEDDKYYLPYLRLLETVDPRVHLIPQSGLQWDTYGLLEEKGLLSEVKTLSWSEGVHPQLSFVSHMPYTIYGDQLIAQLFRSIPSQSWLFKFGRIPLHVILAQGLLQRIVATNARRSPRSKLGIIAQATAELNETVPFKLLQPYNEHFHPTRVNMEEAAGGRTSGHPFTTLSVIPFENQVIAKDDIDKWDYVVRRLLVQKVTPISKTLSLLGPGGQSLLKTIADPNLPPHLRVNPTKSAIELDIWEWEIVVKAFSEWPFAPTELGIDTNFLDTEIRMTN